MKFHLLTLLLALGIGPLAAQHHDRNWIMNDNSFPNDSFLYSIDFNSAIPEVKKLDKSGWFSLFPFACSDSSGQMLFYSNGQALKKANGDPMPATVSLELTPYSGLAGAFALPIPGTTNQYCYFHTELDGNPSPTGIGPDSIALYATTIDLEANGGIGAVTENILLLKDTINPIVACKHGNGRDWWIIAPSDIYARFYVFLLSPSGIEGPFIQQFNQTISSFISSASPNLTVSALSPDGSTYARTHDYYVLALYRFDRCQGSFEFLGEESISPFNAFIYAAFAAESRMLYLNDRSTTYQLDLLAWPRPPDTLILNGEPQSPSFMRQMFLAPNKKIYCLPQGSNQETPALHIIHRPDFPEGAADLSHSELSIGNNTFFDRAAALPNYRLGVLIDSPCDTLLTQLNPNFENAFAGEQPTRHIAPVQTGTFDRSKAILRKLTVPE